MIKYDDIWWCIKLLNEACLWQILLGAVFAGHRCVVVHTVSMSLTPAKHRLDRLLKNPIKFIVIKLWNWSLQQTYDKWWQSMQKSWHFVWKILAQANNISFYNHVELQKGPLDVPTWVICQPLVVCQGLMKQQHHWSDCWCSGPHLWQTSVSPLPGHLFPLGMPSQVKGCSHLLTSYKLSAVGGEGWEYEEPMLVFVERHFRNGLSKSLNMINNLTISIVVS